MAKDKPDIRISEHKKLALDKPRISVLSDQPLATGQTYRDSFNLAYRLSPVYDILRHPLTRTPLAIAVYGSWGAGKTTAMRWLHGLVDLWNEKGEGENKVRVTPVWFYPWKYHSKEDVWRGLVAEVIIKGISVSAPSMAKVANAAKRFGVFLGRSFVHVLAGLTLKAEAPGGGPGAELSLAGIKEILEEYRETARPEQGYLNEFEESLRNWIHETIGDNERMIIFIDDLDRCMPEVALQVLEALKLYLNIDKLIFIVGVDREVIDKLVAEHYEKLGLDREKSKHYLAKMFQVEVDLAPTERQIEEFLDEQFENLPFWREKLSDTEQEIFRDLILELAVRNPREVKRLINSAMMAGAGALVVKGNEERPDPQYTFQQGLQLFFVRKILADRYTQGSLVGRRVGDRFFGQWSRIVREHQGDEDFPRFVRVPSGFLERTAERGPEGEPETTRSVKTPRERKEADKLDLSFAPPAYHSLLTNPAFSTFVKLLGDPDLGELMRIEYPEDTAAIAAATGTTLPEGLIREAVARTLDKKPEELTDKDFAAVQRLNLSGLEISDLAPLRGLINLQELFLSSTQVSDVEPLSGLTSLQALGLERTQVSDLEPLRGLTNLERLFLSGTPVSDLEPLSGLSNLQVLNLWGMQVSDLEPLSGLAKLRALGLEGTRVSDLTPLKGLANLKSLLLEHTPVSKDQVAAIEAALPGLDILR